MDHFPHRNYGFSIYLTFAQGKKNVRFSGASLLSLEELRLVALLLQGVNPHITQSRFMNMGFTLSQGRNNLGSLATLHPFYLFFLSLSFSFSLFGYVQMYIICICRIHTINVEYMGIRKKLDQETIQDEFSQVWRNDPCKTMPISIYQQYVYYYIT